MSECKDENLVGIWDTLQLDVRFVEINSSKVVAQHILELEREIWKLRAIVQRLEEILAEETQKKEEAQARRDELDKIFKNNKVGYMRVDFSGG